MTEETKWLDDLLPPATRDQLGASLERAASEGVASLGGPLNAMARGAVAQFGRNALHVDVLALFADAWSTASELQGYCDAVRHPPGSVSVLKLGAHRVSRELQPQVVIRLGAVERIPMKAGVRVEGGFDGVEISVSDGHIVAVGSGRCELTVQPLLAGRSLHDPIVLHDWELPGRHEFSPPIAIRRSSNEARR